MESATMQPEHNRPLFAVRNSLCPDIHTEQFFFILDGIGIPGDYLTGYRPEFIAFKNSFPCIRLLRRHKSLCLGIGNPLEGTDSIVNTSGYRTRGGLHDGSLSQVRFGVAPCKTKTGCNYKKENEVNDRSHKIKLD